MNKITITNLIDFARKSLRGRKTLVDNLKKTRQSPTPDEGGGDYWISALSTLARFFLDQPDDPIGSKIDELANKIENHPTKQTKDMYQRNINILMACEDYNFRLLKPEADIRLIKKPKRISIVAVKRLPLLVRPHHVYTFKEQDTDKIAAIWFVAKLSGFRMEELAMVADLLYRYLNENYGDKYEVATDYCIVFDVNGVQYLPYSKIENGIIKSPLLPLLTEMKMLF